MNLDTSQQQAIEFATSRRFTIVTGGAGTGKTTIIKGMAEEIRRQAGTDPLLCAFAGKAAARLKEATGFPASTIHRMLGSNGTKFMLETLEGETVICDESSMVSSDLLAEIIRRNPKRLILVGDPAQLPPVGKGQPFHDIISLRPELVTELTTCYRATEAVYRAASIVRTGAMPAMQDQSQSERWEIRATGREEETEEAVLSWVKQGALDFSRDIILCARNGGDKGAPKFGTVHSLNQRIIEIVNPRKGEEQKIAAGDRVINVKNLPKKNIWNGTTGEVLSIDMDGSTWLKLDVPISAADYDGMTDTLLLTKEESRNLELAYALTVHKSQGSQYRRVIFVCLQRDLHCLLDRSLIYTAITRTQEHCVVAGQPPAFREGIRREHPKQTVIQELAKK